MANYYDHEHIGLMILKDLCFFGHMLTNIFFWNSFYLFIRACMHICWLGGFVSYSVFEDPSVVNRCMVNMDITALQTDTKTQKNDFLENGSNRFHWIELRVWYVQENNGIITRRKEICHFSPHRLFRLDAFHFCPVWTSNNGLPNNNLFCIQGQLCTRKYVQCLIFL
jgi:hypothetical protein